MFLAILCVTPRTLRASMLEPIGRIPIQGKVKCTQNVTTPILRTKSLSVDDTFLATHIFLSTTHYKTNDSIPIICARHTLALRCFFKSMNHNAYRLM